MRKPPTLEQLASRMERTLNAQPRHTATRRYMQTLTRRPERVKVQPEEYVRARAIAVHQLERLEQIALEPAYPIIIRKDRIRPRNALGLPRSNRELLYEAQEGLCGGCGLTFNEFEVRTLDHVIPKCRGGSGDISNLLLMHVTCNGRKAGHMPNAYEIEQNKRKNARLA